MSYRRVIRRILGRSLTFKLRNLISEVPYRMGFIPPATSVNKKEGISAMVCTMNEKEWVEPSILSVKDLVDEYVVIDSSTDCTPQIIENLAKMYFKVLRRRMRKDRIREALDFSYELGVFVANFKHLPKLYEEAYNAAEQFAYSIRQLLVSLHSDPLEQYLPSTYFIYGLSQKISDNVLERAKGILMKIFEFRNNMWVFRNDEILERITKKKRSLEIFSDIMRILGEIALKSRKPMRDTYLKILTDLSEILDPKIYAKLFMRVIEKMENKAISKQLLSSVFNVLIDEGKITRDLITRKFYKVINAIDPILARFIVEEVSS